MLCPARVVRLAAVGATAAAIALVWCCPQRAPARRAPLQACVTEPAAFVENLGQWDCPARYVARLGPTTAFLEVDALTLCAAAPGQPGAAVRLRFSGAALAELVPEQKLAGQHSYLLGSDRSRWRSGVPRFARVRYRALWPGVDLVCQERQGCLEYDVELQPGASLRQVELAVEGAQGMHLEGDGTLVLDTAIGALRQAPPATYEVAADGKRRELAARYELHGGHRFGFAVPDWSGEGALVLDPGLVWSTFLGGASSDWPRALAVDAQGVITVGGSTASVDYPVTPGAFNPIPGPGDAFVTRLDPSLPAGQQLLYSTFLGGTWGEEVRTLAVSAAGVITIAGATNSVDFPTTPNAFDQGINGSGFWVWDNFVARLDPSRPAAQQLLYSTFLGGSGTQWPNALAVDATGIVTITGVTTSRDYPTTSTGYDLGYNGLDDVFLTRLDPSAPPAMQVIYSTFLGGSGRETPWDLALDSAGVVTLAGSTDSPDWPTTAGAFDTTFNGGTWPDGDAFVARLDPAQTPAQQLAYSTYLGGSNRDAASGLVVDAVGVITIAGYTDSPDYPTAGSAYDTTYNGALWPDGDAILTRLDPSLPAAQQLLYSTFVGGGEGDWASSLAVDQSGVITFAGGSNSPEYPTTLGAFDSQQHGYVDAFATRLDPSRPPAQQILYSTFLGDQNREDAFALAVDSAGFVTLTGWTRSPGFPTTPGAFATTYGGGSHDAFVARLDMLPTGVSALGRSSPGCQGPLAMLATSLPQAGSAAFELGCNGAPPAASGLLLLGSAMLSTPIRFLGIELWVDPLLPHVVLGTPSTLAGTAYHPLPIPGDPRLIGQTCYAQFLWPSPSSPPPCPPLGASASNALAITIQR